VNSQFLKRPEQPHSEICFESADFAAGNRKMSRDWVRSTSRYEAQTVARPGSGGGAEQNSGSTEEHQSEDAGAPVAVSCMTAAIS